MKKGSVRHGIDLVDVAHLRDVMARHAAFEARVFTDDERSYCRRHPDPLPHFAARFAAKEAALKALGIGITPTGIDRALKEIEVVREGRAPTLRLSGRPLRVARTQALGAASVSLTHTGAHAMASVILQRAGA